MGQLNPHDMEPLVFTLTLFHEHIRQQPDYWRPLGVTQFCENSSADERVQKQSKRTTGRLVRNYHCVLDTILARIVDCQNSPPTVRIQLEINGNLFESTLYWKQFWEMLFPMISYVGLFTPLDLEVFVYVIHVIFGRKSHMTQGIVVNVWSNATWNV
jgi:hypothetical protein